MLWILLALAVLGLFLLAQFILLAVVLTWEDQQTLGVGYYGLPPEGREAFKAKLRQYARLLFPVLRLVGRFSTFTFQKASFQQNGVAGPRGTCSADSFAKAQEYTPGPEDVFVVTQMKCGTTWMLQVVHEVLGRGRGRIVEGGTTLHAISPWIEARKTVSMEAAPLVGEERPSRIIKTHLPVTLLPWSPEARYIYVARHPVSCFASCVDFIATNVGRMAPPLSLVEEWFRSPEWMWWGTWTDHVQGWWERAQSEPNVLFVHFEDMKKDLGRVVDQVAAFLGMEPLTDEERAEIVRKSGFAYMQENQNAFEMHPPHILQTDAQLFVRGTSDRHKDVPADVRARIATWVAADMKDGTYPLAQRYPDVVKSS
ncbi:MAG: sulfotransferase domain-containing protein [Gemmatimonadota bacterium]